LAYQLTNFQVLGFHKKTPAIGPVLNPFWALFALFWALALASGALCPASPIAILFWLCSKLLASAISLTRQEVPRTVQAQVGLHMAPLLSGEADGIAPFALTGAVLFVATAGL
jgi:hypothetical protein